VVLEAAAGAPPPSGVTLLETYALGRHPETICRWSFAKWQAWSAEVLDSHLAYPILAYFRSSHDNDSWISSLGAVMDASTLVLTTIEDGPKGWAKTEPCGRWPLASKISCNISVCRMSQRSASSDRSSKEARMRLAHAWLQAAGS